MSNNKFVTAYSELMEQLYMAMDNTLHSMADALTIAKEKLNKAGSITAEEIEMISDALQRDIESAAHGLPQHQDTNTLTQWFKFDVALIENFALDSFLSLADKTRIELATLGEQAKNRIYLSGEVTMPGTLVCNQCHKEIAFKSPNQIPVCPACQGQEFARV